MNHPIFVYKTYIITNSYPKKNLKKETQTSKVTYNRVDSKGGQKNKIKNQLGFGFINQ